MATRLERAKESLARMEAALEFARESGAPAAELAECWAEVKAQRKYVALGATEEAMPIAYMEYAEAAYDNGGAQ